MSGDRPAMTILERSFLGGERNANAADPFSAGERGRRVETGASETSPARRPAPTQRTIFASLTRHAKEESPLAAALRRRLTRTSSSRRAPLREQEAVRGADRQ